MRTSIKTTTRSNANADVHLHAQADWAPHARAPVRLHTLRTNTDAPNNTNNTPAFSSIWNLPTQVKPAQPQTTPPTSYRIQPRDLDILLATHQYSYISRSQLFELLHPIFQSNRTLGDHLAALVAKKYLAVQPVLQAGRRFPFVYRITHTGVRFLRDIYAEQGIEHTIRPGADPKKNRGVTLQTAVHELITTQLDIAIFRETKAQPHLNLAWHSRRPQPLLAVNPHEQTTTRLVPDSLSLVEITGQQPLLLICEIDHNSHTPLTKIRRKLIGYHHWLHSEDCRSFVNKLSKQNSNRQTPSPRFLWLIANRDARHDDLRLSHILAQALDIPKRTRDRIWLASARRFQQHEQRQLTKENEPGPPLSPPLWTRVRRASSWLPEYRAYIDQLPKGTHRKQRRDRRRHQFIRDKIGAMPVHRLFPRTEDPAIGK